MIVFKRLFSKLLGLNRDIDYRKQYFSASHHSEYKWRHNKIIVKSKILSKRSYYLRCVTVGYGAHKSNFFLSGGRMGCYISYIEWMCSSQVWLKNNTHVLRELQQIEVNDQQP